MKLKNKTIFITGGTSGIGLAYAKEFLRTGNKVIVCGIRKSAIEEIKKTQPNLIVYRCDITNDDEVKKTLRKIQAEHGGFDILINNAGIQCIYDLTQDDKAILKIEKEIDINFTALAKLTKLSLAILTKKSETAIVNISSILAIVPKKSAPIYCATKAAVHSFSKVLRYQLEDTNTKVFDVILPLVDTEMTKSREGSKVSPEYVAQKVIKAMKTNKYEINIGKSRILLILHRLFPALAYKIIKNT